MIVNASIQRANMENVLIGTTRSRVIHNPVFLLSLLSVLGIWPGMASSQTWQPVIGTDELTALFSDTVMTGALKDGVNVSASYYADGTGELKAWGDTFPRKWEVKGEDQICIDIKDQLECFHIEVNSDDPNQYRGRVFDTGEKVVFTLSRKQVQVSQHMDTNEGGASQPSADEIARKLANPNTPLASLTLKIQYQEFQGDLPSADDQSGTTLLFQPSLPFPLANGDSILFRPAIPFQVNFPTIDPDTGDFDSISGMGDIAFDIAYAKTTKTGMLYAGGIIASLPTATKDALGTGRFTLGPEFLIGKISKTYVIGAYPNHQWDIGGSGDADINLTSMQAFAIYLPGGGWSLGSAPNMSYDHIDNQWTIPLNFTFGKTVIWGKRPWRMGMEVNYFVDQADAFGPDWFIGFNVAPVVENALAGWFKQ